MLDILQLCKLGDNRDARCWILARGKNLRKQVDFLQDELLRIMSKDNLINFLTEKAGVTLKIKFKGLSVKEWLSQIEKLRIKEGLSFKKMMKLTGTAGNRWSEIQRGEWLPYCKKLKKIIELVNLKVDAICDKDDFCLRSIDTIVKSLDSEWLPLIVISSLLELFKIRFCVPEEQLEEIKKQILNSVDQLKVLQNNSKPIKVAKKIDKNLAKIIGAFAADGNYYPPDMIRWEDEYKEQLEILANWFYITFGIKLKIKPSKRNRKSFEMKFRNKIIGRYLEVFFGFKPVDKRYTVGEPELIKSQPLKIRKAFATGALMFDGSVNSDCTVSFSSVSKRFRDSVSEILLEDGINLSIPKKPNKSKRFGSSDIWYFYTYRKIDVVQLKKLASYFERESMKRNVIDFYLGEFKISNISHFRFLFPKLRSKLQPDDLVNIIVKLENFDVYQLIGQTNLSRQILLRYLRILERANLIKSEIRKGKRIYSPNSWLTNDALLNSTKSKWS